MNNACGSRTPYDAECLRRCHLGCPSTESCDGVAEWRTGTTLRELQDDVQALPALQRHLFVERDGNLPIVFESFVGTAILVRILPRLSDSLRVLRQPFAFHEATVIHIHCECA